MLGRGSCGRDGQRRPFLRPVRQDQVVQGPADALPPPRRADQEFDQRKGASGVLSGDLVGQRGGQVPPPVGRRAQRHPERVAHQVTAVPGLGQGEPRLPALNQETVGERRAVTGADLGVQHLQFARVRRGLRPAEQLERHAGLRHGRLSP
jgi:hypothetical protein